MSSVDFRAFCQAEATEKKRLLRVYRGEDHDLATPAEHYLPEDIPDLISKDITPALRAMYLYEYSNLTSHMRAVAAAGLMRRDMYQEAMYTAGRDITYWNSAVAVNNKRLQLLSTYIKDSLFTELSEAEAAAIETKIRVKSRIKTVSGYESAEGLKDKDVVKTYMKDQKGVNSRGTSNKPLPSD